MPPAPEMASPPPCHQTRRRFTSSKHSMIADGFIFSAGAASALLLFWAFSSFLRPPSPSSPIPSHTTFYDDPSLSYSLSPSPSITDWDAKRRHWLRLHHSSPSTTPQEPILMLTGSQPTPCRNPIGDHLLLRLLKNKVDYCRLHGISIFHNSALLHSSMPSFWSKLPLLRAAMLAHPDSTWLWWVDSDAAVTDMDFQLPLRRYRSHNLVVHGWPHLIYQNHSWTALNAGVFLLRNCQWSLDFLNRWARFGPQNPDYAQWGTTLRSELPDKLFPDSDDQSALIYLLLREKKQWGEKIYLESEYYFQGYWVEIVGRLQGIAEKYLEMEKGDEELRRRRAETVAAEENARRRRQTGLPAGWKRPFITHFTGCQPCSGDHNEIYSGESCYEGMVRALNFADDQVLRSYGFRHRDMMNDTVVPLPFGFPATD